MGTHFYMPPPPQGAAAGSGSGDGGGGGGGAVAGDGRPDGYGHSRHFGAAMAGYGVGLPRVRHLHGPDEYEGWGGG